MRLSALLLFLAAPVALAQIQQVPSAASTRLYFAQLADGGPDEQKWTSTFILINPGTLASGVTLQFFTDAGQPWAIDFGQGARTSYTGTLDPGAAMTLTSKGSSSTTASGWASMTADMPLIGTVLYRATQKGSPVSEVAAPGTGLTYYYNSWVTPLSGIAVANPNSVTIHLNLSAKDLAGKAAGSQILTVPAGGQLVFNLMNKVAGLAADFSGSLSITSADATNVAFTAWVLNVRNNLLAPLPPGETRMPAPGERRVFDAFARMQAAIRPLFDTLGKDSRNFTRLTKQQVLDLIASFKVVVDPEATLKATYLHSDKSIHISQLMLELLGDSDSAIAFLVARMAGKGVLIETGLPPTGSTSTDPEGVLDSMGMLVAMKAGYDPNGAMDFYGRMVAAYGMSIPYDATLVTEYSLDNPTPRVKRMANYVWGACNQDTDAVAECKAVRSAWHPHYPSTIPW